MAKEPGSRYHSAQELADDLRRFLEYKPIKAKRPTALELVAKWSRRHIAVVISAATVLGLAAVGLAITTAIVSAQQTEVTRQRDRARRAIDDLFTDVSGQLLTQKNPDLEKVRRNFLEKGLGYYQEFAVDHDGTTASLYQAATAYRRVADIYRNMGRQREAAEAIGRAIDLLQIVIGHYPENGDYRYELADHHHLLGIFLCDIGKLHESEQAYQRALDLLKALSVQFPNEPRYTYLSARARGNSCMTLEKLARFPEAETRYRQSLTEVMSLASSFPGEPLYRRLAAGIDTSLARILIQKGRPAEAEKALAEALAIVEPLSEQFPHSPEYQEGLRRVLVAKSIALMQSGEIPEAEVCLRHALVVAERVAEATPGPWPLGDVAGIHQALGKIQMADGRLDEAEMAFHTNLDLVRQWVAAIPAVSDRLELIAECYANLGRVLFAKRKHAEARHYFQEARKQWEQKIAAAPDEPTNRRDLAWFLASCPDSTCRGAARAIELAQTVVAKTPHDSLAWAALGIACYDDGQSVGAVSALKTAAELSNGGDATVWIYLAMALAQTGDMEQARSWYTRASDWMTAKRPKDQDLRGLCAKAAARLDSHIQSPVEND